MRDELRRRVLEEGHRGDHLRHQEVEQVLPQRLREIHQDRLRVDALQGGARSADQDMDIRIEIRIEIEMKTEIEFEIKVKLEFDLQIEVEYR